MPAHAVECLPPELRAGEDAGDHVPLFAGGDVAELQRGVPSTIPENHPHLRGRGPGAEGNYVPRSGEPSLMLILPVTCGHVEQRDCLYIQNCKGSDEFVFIVRTAQRAMSLCLY